jgi:hypothetical protein
MKQKPILDRFEIKGIQSISTLEHRALAEHRVPGLAGTLFQDMGSEPVRIAIRGSLSYDEGRQDVLNLEDLRKAFIDGKAVPFVADITTATKVTEVLINEIEIQESERWPGYFEYRIDLVEHVPEPPEAEVQQDVEREAEERHENTVQQATGGLVTIEVSVELEEGASPVVVISDTSGNEVRRISEHTPDGIYVAEDLPTGDYTVRVE